MESILVGEPQKKKGNLARRERNRPDYPILIYKYAAEIGGQKDPFLLPTEVYEEAEEMRKLWNRMVEANDEHLAELKLRRIHDLIDGNGKEIIRSVASLTDDEIAMPYKELAIARTKELESRLTRIAKDSTATGYCYYDVRDRFNICRKEALQGKRRPPRKSHKLDSFQIPIMFFGGIEWERLFQNTKRTPVYLREKLGYTYGFMNIGKAKYQLPLNVIMHRLPPSGSFIKKFALVGRKSAAFGWKFTVQMMTEIPPRLPFPKANRACGIDVGWRVFEDRIRLAVIADESGRELEIAMPLKVENASRRSEREFIESFGRFYNKGTDIRDVFRFEQTIGDLIEDTKERLKTLSIKEKASWTMEALSMMRSLTRIRCGGLFKLRQLLRGTGTEAEALLDRFAADLFLYRRRKAGFEDYFHRRKLDFYRKIVDWITSQYDVIAWEHDLSLKKMAEDSNGSPILDNAQTYRQLVGLYNFRKYLQESVIKKGRRLVKVKATNTTLRCHECGSKVKEVNEQRAKLFLECRNGHAYDQDVNASRNLLAQAIEEKSDAIYFDELPMVSENIAGWFRGL